MDAKGIVRGLIRIPDYDMKDEGISYLKREINNLIWMEAPDSITLKEADERAMKILDLIKSKRNIGE